MPGRMGGVKVTTQNLEVVKVDIEQNLLLVKGSVPGHANSLLIIRRALKKPFKEPTPPEVNPEADAKKPASAEKAAAKDEAKGTKKNAPKEEKAKSATGAKDK